METESGEIYLHSNWLMCLDVPAKDQSEKIFKFKSCYLNKIEMRSSINEISTQMLVSLLGQNKEFIQCRVWQAMPELKTDVKKFITFFDMLPQFK